MYKMEIKILGRDEKHSKAGGGEMLTYEHSRRRQKGKHRRHGEKMERDVEGWVTSLLAVTGCCCIAGSKTEVSREGGNKKRRRGLRRINMAEMKDIFLPSYNKLFWRHHTFTQKKQATYRDTAGKSGNTSNSA